MALAEADPEAFLFSTKTGRSLSVSNYERLLLRAFVVDERTQLVKLGIDVDEYTTHIYRRTAATLIARRPALPWPRGFLATRMSRLRETATWSPPTWSTQ